jgi:hypothetical protein
LGTTFSQGFFVFPREISSFSLGKLKIPWKNVVAKLTLRFKNSLNGLDEEMNKTKVVCLEKL